MPTGYTHKIPDGQPFNEFLWGCARAFGAFVTVRDEPNDTPIPEKFEISDYYTKAVEAKSELVRMLDGFSNAEWQERLDASYDANVQSYEEILEKNNRTNARYKAMLKQVEEWVPPTDEHIGLKDFMIQQISESIRFDCYEPTRPEKPSLEEFKKSELANAHRSLKYSETALQEEIERVEGRNKWIADLRQSVPTN